MNEEEYKVLNWEYGEIGIMDDGNYIRRLLYGAVATEGNRYAVFNLGELRDEGVLARKVYDKDEQKKLLERFKQF